MKIENSIPFLIVIAVLMFVVAACTEPRTSPVDTDIMSSRYGKPVTVKLNDGRIVECILVYDQPLVCDFYNAKDPQ